MCWKPADNAKMVNASVLQEQEYDTNNYNTGGGNYSLGGGGPDIYAM